MWEREQTPEHAYDSFEIFKQEIAQLKESIVWHQSKERTLKAKEQPRSREIHENLDESLLETAYTTHTIKEKAPSQQQKETIPSPSRIAVNKKQSSENIITYIQTLPKNFITNAIKSIIQRDTQQS